MPRSDDPIERLREAIDAVAADDAADLLAEARIEARARVRASLTDALAASMLEHLHGELPEREARPTTVREARPTTTRDARPTTAPEARPTTAPEASPEPPRQAVPEPPAGPAPAGQPAWYVYGVIRSDEQLTGPLPGVDPAEPVTVLREGALAAVASRVPLEEFDEARLREHLADMTWVEATARAHEAVLDRLCDQATVIPMRMCTVYRTEGGVREMLHREAEPLDEALDALAGKAEWGVKAFVSPDPEGGGPGTADASGAAYMERKRTQRERRQQAMDLANEAAVVIHHRLSGLVSDAHIIPLQRREASGYSADMILNGVYLVDDDAVDAFREAVRALRSEFEPQGIELVPTGPWPAYNFIPGTIGAAW